MYNGPLYTALYRPPLYTAASGSSGAAVFPFSERMPATEAQIRGFPMYSFAVIGILAGIGGMTATENNLDQTNAQVIWAVSLILTLGSFLSFGL